MKRWSTFQLKVLFSSLFLPLFVNLGSIKTTHGLGVKDFGDDCDPTHSFSQYETEKCNSIKGLHCNPVQKECKCFISGAYYQRGKCRAKVNKFCGTIDDLVVECVKNSFCNTTRGTGVCQCEGVLLANGEGTACYKDNSSKLAPIGSLNLLVMIFLLLVISYKL